MVCENLHGIVQKSGFRHSKYYEHKTEGLWNSNSNKYFWSLKRKPLYITCYQWVNNFTIASLGTFRRKDRLKGGKNSVEQGGNVYA